MAEKALLVIDIQEDYTGINANKRSRYKKADELIIRVNKIIGKCVANDINIIYIKHEFQGTMPILLSKLFSHGTAIKGNAGTEIDQRINIVSDNIFIKNSPSAFSNKEFKEYLKQKNIEELFLVGLDGMFCVKETAKSAIKENYKVNIIKNAVLFKNEKMINKVYYELEEKGANILSEI